MRQPSGEQTPGTPVIPPHRSRHGSQEGARVNILLYNPDNGVTRNYMPHLWMFLLQSLTPAPHRVLLIDANASPLTEEGMKDYIAEHEIGLVGIGAMTRMAAKAYRMAAVARAAGAK